MNRKGRERLVMSHEVKSKQSEPSDVQIMTVRIIIDAVRYPLT